MIEIVKQARKKTMTWLNRPFGHFEWHCQFQHRSLLKTNRNSYGLFFSLHIANGIYRLGKAVLLKDAERFRKKHAESPSEQSQVVALTSSFVEETRQVIMMFFNLPDGCRWVQKEIEKDRQRKVN